MQKNLLTIVLSLFLLTSCTKEIEEKKEFNTPSSKAADLKEYINEHEITHLDTKHVPYQGLNIDQTSGSSSFSFLGDSFVVVYQRHYNLEYLLYFDQYDFDLGNGETKRLLVLFFEKPTS